MNGESKSYSMIRRRKGYAAGPKEIIKAKDQNQSQSNKKKNLNNEWSK